MTMLFRFVQHYDLSSLISECRREIPVLEDKVRFLMEKLDMAPKTSTGTRGAPPGSDAEVSSGGSGDQGSDARRDA